MRLARAPGEERAFSAGLVYAGPLVYFLHLLDERFWGEGTAVWATRHTQLVLTNEAWLVINLVSMSIMLGVAWAVVRRRLPEWAMLAVAVHLMLHGMTRVAATIGSGSVAPGFATGLSLCVPLAMILFVAAKGAFAGRTVALAAGLGVLSFQPLLHLALHTIS